MTPKPGDGKLETNPEATGVHVGEGGVEGVLTRGNGTGYHSPLEGNNPLPKNDPKQESTAEDQSTLPPPVNLDLAPVPPPAVDSWATRNPDSYVASATADARAPAGYRIQRELGRGGMGWFTWRGMWRYSDPVR